MAHEPHIFGRWLKTLLVGNDALMEAVADVCRGKMPQGTPLPYVTWEVAGTGQDDTTGCGRIHARFLVGMELWSDDQADKTKPESGQEQLDALLTGQRGKLAENHRITLLPRGIFGGTTTFDGIRYLRSEGRYWQVVVTNLAGPR